MALTTEQEINDCINQYSGEIMMSDLIRVLLGTLVDNHIFTMGQVRAMLDKAASRGIPLDRS